uniref:Uncharacterized protein n=1 Tax=Magallana gigas TaxID=29159 RepID=K1QFK0_MAGGI
MFRSQTDKHCPQCLRTSSTRGSLLFQGMEQTVKKYRARCGGNRCQSKSADVLIEQPWILILVPRMYPDVTFVRPP